MNPAQLADAVRAALADAVTSGDLAVTVPDEITIDRPRSREHGDYATPVALKLAKQAGVAPRAIAEALAPRLRAVPGIAGVDIAGPGFLNIRLDAAAAGALVGQIVRAGARYGTGLGLAGHNVNLEFVSANPTGPLHLGHARWAAVGDALGRVMRAQGAAVSNEYYFNDAGVQIDRFASSLLAAARDQPVPTDGYGGAYIAEIAERIVAGHPEAPGLPDAEAMACSAARASSSCSTRSSRRCTPSGPTSTSTSTRTRCTPPARSARRRTTPAVRPPVRQGRRLVAAHHRVRRRQGPRRHQVRRQPRLRRRDLAYFVDKRARGFDLAIYMLGADHHGYIARLKAAAAALGDDPDSSRC